MAANITFALDASVESSRFSLTESMLIDVGGDIPDITSQSIGTTYEALNIHGDVGSDACFVMIHNTGNYPVRISVDQTGTYVAEVAPGEFAFFRPMSTVVKVAAVGGLSNINYILIED